MSRSRTASTPESLAHYLQRKPSEAITSGRAGPLLDEVKDLIPQAGEIYLVEPDAYKVADMRIANSLSHHQQAEIINFLAASVAKITAVTIIETSMKSLRQFVLIVPSRPEYESAIPAQMGLTRFYLIAQTEQGESRAPHMLPFSLTFNPFASDDKTIKAKVGECFRAVGDVALAADTQNSFFSHVLASLSVIDMLHRQVDYILPNRHTFGSENMLRRARKKPLYAPVTTLRIDPEKAAVITYSHAAQEIAQRAHASGYTYDRPFIVRPKAKAIHAKGGTPEQRAALNAALKGKSPHTVEELLKAFDSPQAERPRVARVTLGKPALK